jgi:topoisomerase-4 subunit B
MVSVRGDEPFPMASTVKVAIAAEYQDRQSVRDLVERLMGKDPAHRFHFIQNNAASLSEDEIDA